MTSSSFVLVSLKFQRVVAFPCCYGDLKHRPTIYLSLSFSISLYLSILFYFISRFSVFNPISIEFQTDMHYDYIIKVFLMAAASRGQIDEVKELVRMVNDIEYSDLDETEETPRKKLFILLHHVYPRGHSGSHFSLLNTSKLKIGRNLLAIKFSSLTICFVCACAVHAAVRYRQVEVCKVLVSCTSSKLDIVNAAGATYLTLAAAFGFTDICRIVTTE
jgi:hypothetical protein